MNTYIPYIKCKNANESWLAIMEHLNKYGEISAPRGQKIKEILGFNICIENPLDRIIYSPTRKMSMSYAVGEFIYYITGDNSLDFISYYSKQFENFTDDGKTINSAYGHRIFGKSNLINFNQWEFIKNKLKEDPDTRQAIIHLHLPNNKPTNDELCTLTLQFMIRNDKLNLLVNMRSNDIIWGYTYDVFNFTLLQELMANELNIPIGYYYHNAASMHIYEKDWDKLNNLNYDKLDYEFNLNNIILESNELKDLIKYEELIRKSNNIYDFINLHLSHETLNNMLDILKQKKLNKMFKNNEIDEDTYKNKSINNIFLDKHYFL